MDKKWNLPPPAENLCSGHMDSPDGIYLQTMFIKEIEERLKVNDVIIIHI